MLKHQDAGRWHDIMAALNSSLICFSCGCTESKQNCLVHPEALPSQLLGYHRVQRLAFPPCVDRTDDATATMSLSCSLVGSSSSSSSSSPPSPVWTAVQAPSRCWSVHSFVSCAKVACIHLQKLHMALSFYNGLLPSQMHMHVSDLAARCDLRPRRPLRSWLRPWPSVPVGHAPAQSRSSGAYAASVLSTCSGAGQRAMLQPRTTLPGPSQVHKGRFQPSHTCRSAKSPATSGSAAAPSAASGDCASTIWPLVTTAPTPGASPSTSLCIKRSFRTRQWTLPCA